MHTRAHTCPDRKSSEIDAPDDQACKFRKRKYFHFRGHANKNREPGEKALTLTVRASPAKVPTFPMQTRENRRLTDGGRMRSDFVGEIFQPLFAISPAITDGGADVNNNIHEGMHVGTRGASCISCR